MSDPASAHPGPALPQSGGSAEVTTPRLDADAPGDEPGASYSAGAAVPPPRRRRRGSRGGRNRNRGSVAADEPEGELPLDGAAAGAGADLAKEPASPEAVQGGAGAGESDEDGPAEGPDQGAPAAGMPLGVAGSADGVPLGVAGSPDGAATGGPAVGPAVWPAVDPAVGPAAESAVGPAVHPALGPAVHPAVGPAVGSAVGPAVESAVWPAVDPAVGPAVESAVGPAEVASTGGSTGSPPETAAVGPAEVVSAAGTATGASRPKIGDTRPAPVLLPPRRERPTAGIEDGDAAAADNGDGERSPRRRRRTSRGRSGADRRPVEAALVDEPVEVDDETLERRRGRERKGRPIGRYLMVVHSQPTATQIAVLEGRALIEHYVSRRADDATQIDGNIYLGRVQNVLPGMEAAFIDIGTPKNAVLYRGDVRYDKEDLEAAPPYDGGPAPTRGRLAGAARTARIEQLLKTGQTIVCQVTKNPIGTKGARLTQEVSLPGRFVVLIPGSDTYGISKRLPDEERKRLRRVLDDVRPEGHGLIVRTAAEGATADELRRDVARLREQWDRIDAMAKSARTPALLYREPDMAVRVIREEFNRNYRGVVIDDPDLFEEVRDYVASISPELADRVEWAGDSDDPLPVFERYHVHEQIHRALDRKVWLASGGSLIIERTEALTVIDVNTGKNVGTSNLEETVFRNNLEAAEEIARQLRLRDIGGIIVIDFIDMEIAANRTEVIKTFRAALARDKTRTQVFDISELGLVEMTRKRISEGLVESFSETCPTCGGRGIIFDQSLLL